MIILPKGDISPQEQAEFFAKHRLGSDYDFRESSDYVQGYIEGVKRYIEDIRRREVATSRSEYPLTPEDCAPKKLDYTKSYEPDRDLPIDSRYYTEKYTIESLIEGLEHFEDFYNNYKDTIIDKGLGVIANWKRKR